MSYEFRFKKESAWFWRRRRGIVGHYYDHQIVDGQENGHRYQRQPQDRMILYYEDGSIEAIPNWSRYTMKLGQDWVLFTKREMEKKSGQPVQLNVSARSA